MKKKCTLILILMVFLFKIINAQWQNVGPAGGMVYDIVQNGSNQLCLTPGGLYFSSNNGTNWVPSRGGIPFVEIRTINVSGNKFVTGTGNGVYASTDGLNWTLQGNSQLKIIYSRGNYLFAVAYAIPSRAVFRSTDAGATWQSTPVNFDIGLGITSIDTILFIGTQNGTAYSINNGQSWVGMNILVGGFGIGAVTDIKIVSGGLLIATSSGLYKHNGNTYSTTVQNASNGIPATAAPPARH